MKKIKKIFSCLAIASICLGVFSSSLFCFTKKKLPKTQTIITVLCYHHVDGPARTKYSVTSLQLTDQLTALENQGYKFISLAQLEKFLLRTENIPPKSAVITFDDGNYNIYKKAYPLLQQKKIPFAFFVYPASVNKGHAANCADWADLREMAKHGVTIGSHSLNHPFLTKPPQKIKTSAEYNEWLYQELVVSKKIIEKKTGQKIKYFAVPYGAFDQHIYKNLKKSGYALVLNVSGMQNDYLSDPYNINRIIVYGTDTLATFLKNSTAKPLHFNYLYPANLSHISTASPTIKFGLKNMENLKPNTIHSKISSFHGVAMVHNKNTNLYEEQVTFKKPWIYLVSITAYDNANNFYRGDWLFLYDKTTPSFINVQTP